MGLTKHASTKLIGSSFDIQFHCNGNVYSYKRDADRAYQGGCGVRYYLQLVDAQWTDTHTYPVRPATNDAVIEDLMGDMYSQRFKLFWSHNIYKDNNTWEYMMTSSVNFPDTSDPHFRNYYTMFEQTKALHDF